MNSQSERIILMVRRGEYQAAAEAWQRLSGCTPAEAKQTIDNLRVTLARRSNKQSAKEAQ